MGRKGGCEGKKRWRSCFVREEQKKPWCERLLMELKYRVFRYRVEFAMGVEDKHTNFEDSRFERFDCGSVCLLVDVYCGYTWKDGWIGTIIPLSPVNIYLISRDIITSKDPYLSITPNYFVQERDFKRYLSGRIFSDRIEPFEKKFLPRLEANRIGEQ